MGNNRSKVNPVSFEEACKKGLSSLHILRGAIDLFVLIEIMCNGME